MDTTSRPRPTTARRTDDTRRVDARRVDDVRRVDDGARAGGARRAVRARLAAALAVPVVALALAGCAGAAGGAATPAPSVPSETPPPTDAPGGDAAGGDVDGPEVLGERWADAPAPELGPDGTAEPTAGWVEPGARFFVTTLGSSSCPLAPTGLLPSAAEGALTVEFTRVGGPMCTMDFSPSSWVLDLPAELADAAPLTVTLAGEVDPAVDVVLER